MKTERKKNEKKNEKLMKRGNMSTPLENMHLRMLKTLLRLVELRLVQLRLVQL